MEPSPFKVSRALILGDFVVLLLFSLAGWVFHKGGGEWYSQVARIGFPFVLGYFTSAFLLGALLRDPDGQRFARKSTKAWLSGVILSLFLRTILEGRFPIWSFVLVAAVFTAITLLGWRAVFWLVSRRRSLAS